MVFAWSFIVFWEGWSQGSFVEETREPDRYADYVYAKKITQRAKRRRSLLLPLLGFRSVPPSWGDEGDVSPRSFLSFSLDACPWRELWLPLGL